MPSFAAELEHELSFQEAVIRLQRFGDRMREAYAEHITELEESWQAEGCLDFSFKVMGLAIAGQVVTDEDRVRVSGSLPFAALPFRGQLEQEIRNRLSEALNHQHGR